MVEFAWQLNIFIYEDIWGLFAFSWIDASMVNIWFFLLFSWKSVTGGEKVVNMGEKQEKTFEEMLEMALGKPWNPLTFGTLLSSSTFLALVKSASDIVASFEGGAIGTGFLWGSRRVLLGCSFGMVLEAVLEDVLPIRFQTASAKICTRILSFILPLLIFPLRQYLPPTVFCYIYWQNYKNY